jgi:hypothetical protein
MDELETDFVRLEAKTQAERLAEQFGFMANRLFAPSSHVLFRDTYLKFARSA